MTELEVIKKTCGASNGYYDPTEFEAKFGVNPHEWPKLFEITSRTNLVCKREYHERTYQEHLDGVAIMGERLGVRNSANLSRVVHLG